MEHVKRGKLKLKTGAALKVASSSSSDRKQKKKKKSKHKKHVHDDSSNGGDNDNRGDGNDADTEIIVNDMTPAQRRHEEHRKKREQAEIEKAAGKTYRERVEELNQYLGSLTEHHDIPRVSAAGNG